MYENDECHHRQYKQCQYRMHKNVYVKDAQKSKGKIVEKARIENAD